MTEHSPEPWTIIPMEEWLRSNPRPAAVWGGRHYTVIAPPGVEIDRDDASRELADFTLAASAPQMVAALKRAKRGLQAGLKDTRCESLRAMLLRDLTVVRNAIFEAQ